MKPLSFRFHFCGSHELYLAKEGSELSLLLVSMSLLVVVVVVVVTVVVRYQFVSLLVLSYIACLSTPITWQGNGWIRKPTVIQ